MDKSPDTVDSVADNIFAAAERGQFMIIPTQREPMYWRMKRWLPEMYFRKLRDTLKKRQSSRTKP